MQDATDDRNPKDEPAEMKVLACILRQNGSLDLIVQHIGAGDFYFDKHQKIFAAAMDLHSAGKPIDAVTLADKLNLLQQIESIGGYEYLAVLWDCEATAANAEHYASIIRDKAILRGIISASTESINEATKPTDTAEVLLSAAERRILEIASGKSSPVLTLAESVNTAMERINDRLTFGGITSSGIPTGFTDLDHLLGGFQPCELVIIAARPSVGKTAIALNMIRHIIVDRSIPTLFVSLEQSHIEVAERLLSCQSRVDSFKLRTGRLNSDDVYRLSEASEYLRNAPLYIDDCVQQSMIKIAATARRINNRNKESGGLKLIVIDYLQLIEPESRREPRHEQVAQISRRLKFLARELKIPVIALAQVNRSADAKEDSAPKLSNLRESGSIEQDADTVLMLHRPNKIEGEPDNGIIEVTVAKQRNGPTGQVTLAYLKQFMRFEDYADPDAFR
jgi:replicative DNA helicase